MFLGSLTPSTPLMILSIALLYLLALIFAWILHPRSSASGAPSSQPTHPSVLGGEGVSSSFKALLLAFLVLFSKAALVPLSLVQGGLTLGLIFTFILGLNLVLPSPLPPLGSPLLGALLLLPILSLVLGGWMPSFFCVEVASFITILLLALLGAQRRALLIYTLVSGAAALVLLLGLSFGAQGGPALVVFLLIKFGVAPFGLWVVSFYQSLSTPTLLFYLSRALPPMTMLLIITSSLAPAGAGIGLSLTLKAALSLCTILVGSLGVRPDGSLTSTLTLSSLGTALVLALLSL